MIHKIRAPAYQGRTPWPTFNVDSADRMLEYDECSGTEKHDCVGNIARHPHCNRNSWRISGTANGKGPQILYVGLSGSRRALLVSSFPDGLEEGIWDPAA